MKSISFDSVRTIGRTYETNGGLWFALSGAGIEFEFTGKRLDVTFLGDGASVAEDKDSRARAAVFINGERVCDPMIDSREKTVTVIESDSVKTFTVRVIKLSECAMSTLGLKPLSVGDADTVCPTKPKPHRIEFIGDSITCGYGVDDEDPLHHFSTATEDVTRAYAYKTAELLGAEYSMFSTSGYGIISGYTEGERIPEQTIPQYYESYGFSYQRFADETAPQSLEWDFSRYVPELIVINLGTNDDSYCKDDAEKQAFYTEEYVRFLGLVREKNPSAYILCTVGIMGQRIFGALDSAVERYKTESGDARIFSMLFDEQKPEDGLVADYHPTAVTHNKAAKRLSAEIRRIMKM